MIPKIAGQTSPRGNHPDIPDPLQHEYKKQQALFLAQTATVQRFLNAQANLLAASLIDQCSEVHFKLPDEVVTEPPNNGSASAALTVLHNQREQTIGRPLGDLIRAEMHTRLRNRLFDLEGSNDRAAAVSAGLIRYATSAHLVHRILPTGRAVQYTLLEDEEIPATPLGEVDEVESAITAETDAIAESGPQNETRGGLLVPFVPAARRFYLPQWVAFDDEGRLLLSTIQEAEAHIASIQRFTSVLHIAVGLTPCIVADEEYQRKRYGILGQLVNQGRALARYQTQQIIEIIQQRAARGDLNRGLSLSLPYFDDQDLQIKLRNFEVIPSGRIMFVPAFIVHAAHEEQAKVAQDTRLSVSTRKYLLKQLEMLGEAFLSDSELYQ